MGKDHFKGVLGLTQHNTNYNYRVVLEFVLINYFNTSLQFLLIAVNETVS